MKQQQQQQQSEAIYLPNYQTIFPFQFVVVVVVIIRSSQPAEKVALMCVLNSHCCLYGNNNICNASFRFHWPCPLASHWRTSEHKDQLIFPLFGFLYFSAGRWIVRLTEYHQSPVISPAPIWLPQSELPIDQWATLFGHRRATFRLATVLCVFVCSLQGDSIANCSLSLSLPSWPSILRVNHLLGHSFVSLSGLLGWLAWEIDR